MGYLVTDQRNRRDKERSRNQGPRFEADATETGLQKTTCAACGEDVMSDGLVYSEQGLICAACDDAQGPDEVQLAVSASAWGSLWIPIPGLLIAVPLFLGVVVGGGVPVGKGIAVWFMAVLFVLAWGLFTLGAGVRGLRWSRHEASDEVAPWVPWAHRWATAAGGFTVLSGVALFLAPLVYAVI